MVNVQHRVVWGPVYFCTLFISWRPATFSITYFFLFLISSTIIMMRHNTLLTINGILPVRAPESAHNAFPALTSNFIFIGFFASIPPALSAVAIHPAICDMMYNITSV